MKKRYFILSVLVLIFVVSSFTSAVRPVMAGGWTIQTDLNAFQVETKKLQELLAAGNSAYKKYALKDVEKLYTQVVAGLNFKYIANFTYNNLKVKLEIVMYRNLRSDYMITSIKKLK